MVRIAGIAGLAAAALLGFAGCSDDDNSNTDVGADDGGHESAVLAEFGEACAVDGDCRSGACFETRCTRACNDRTDCPAEGYACGLADADRVLCVTTRFATGAGTSGESCVSTTCDEAAGFRCIRTMEGDAYAYCTHDCTDDRDCPYQMTCRDGSDGRYCRPRGYCEPCLLDDQCGYANDDCVADDQGDKFCSQACDPASSTSCPTDSVCTEIESGRWQCKPSFGRCVGDGGLCEPCREDADCADGNLCLTDRYTHASFCGSDCDSGSDCPDQYYCTSELPHQCRPRKGSCLEPSGGGHTCDSCEDFSDCFNGWCLDPDGDGYPPYACADPCSSGDPDSCGPWGSCFEITSGGTTVGYACLPHTGLACWQYDSCVADCPDGASGCSHSFCR